MNRYIYAILIFLVSVFSSSTFALPFQYSFQGNVTDIEYSDSTGSYNLYNVGEFLELSDVTYFIGDEITYNFRVDLLQPGSCYDPSAVGAVSGCNATAFSEIIVPPGASFNYFESSLISASKSTSLNWQDIQLGYGLTSSSRQDLIQGESAIWVEGIGNSNVEDWLDSTSLTPTLVNGFDRWQTATLYGTVYSSMTLISITALPVPEPSTIFLLLLGMIFIGFNYRRNTELQLKS